MTFFSCRNLGWKTDKKSKAILSQSSVVTLLTRKAMEVSSQKEQQQQLQQSDPEALSQSSKEESTLRVILSALWNLSAHCTKNKVRI